METTSEDIVAKLIDTMCCSCTNFKVCHKCEGEVKFNHDQMLICMGTLNLKLGGNRPKTFSDVDGVLHNILYCPDYLKRDQILFGEKVDWKERGNHHKEFEIDVEVITKLGMAEFIDLTHDDYTDNMPPPKDFFDMANDNRELTVKGECRPPDSENSKYDSGITFNGLTGKDIPLDRLQDLIYMCRQATELDFDIKTASISACWD